LDGNRGSYSIVPNDPAAEQRIAAVRLFLWCDPQIVPTVRLEASRILSPAKLEEHMRFIDYSFAEITLDGPQTLASERRANELLAYHPTGIDDCRIVAETEQAPEIPVLVTFDRDLKRNLRPHTRLRIETPTECWAALNIPHGTPSQWTPASSHPLANEPWWHW
jgi:hypothetical protein